MAENPLPPLNWLRAFECSARHLSFTNAAAELNMTQSAVSQHIRNLEQFLGRPLFVRRKRGLQLTETANAYLPTVQEAFETLATGTSALTGGERGRILTVQANLGFAVFWLTPRLGSLFAVHPWLRINILTAIWDPDRNTMPGDVEIRFMRRDDDHGLIRLNHDRAYPVCAPALVQSGEPDWRGHPLFDCSGVLANWQAWLAARRERLPGRNAVNLSSSYSVSLNAAAVGAGFAMAHDTIARHLLANGELVRPFGETIEMEEAYYLTRLATHAETPATRAFGSWLLETLAAETTAS